jgi:hypothetical protein
MTIIHGFTSFNTITPVENRAFVNLTPGPTKACALQPFAKEGGALAVHD